MKATKIFGYNALICLFAGIFNEIFIKLFLDGDSTTKEKIFGALAWCFLFAALQTHKNVEHVDAKAD